LDEEKTKKKTRNLKIGKVWDRYIQAAFLNKYMLYWGAGIAWVEFVVGSRLAPRVFLWVLRFSSLHKNQRLQIPIQPRQRTCMKTS